MRAGYAFWDSSALVPLCVRQLNSRQAQLLVRRLAPVAWWATIVEINSAIARSYRSGDLDDKGRQDAITALIALSQTWEEILPDEKLRDQASVLLYSYALRAADGLQLAAAMLWCDQKPSGVNFVCDDTRLSQAASQSGFTVLSLAASTQ